MAVLQLVFIACITLIRISNQHPNPKNFGYAYTSYQRAITCTSAFTPLHPTSLEDIQNIIHFARKSNVTVKAVGHLHSISDLICTDGIPLNMDSINHFRYNPSTGHATVGAGATFSQLIEQLHMVGRALTGFPTYGGITVGGAVGTGVHGSTLTLPTTVSDQMVGVVVVDGLGNQRNISGGPLLNAFRAHLGLLGVLYEVTVKTVPQYKVRRVTSQHPDTILFTSPEQILGIARTTPFFDFVWYPTSKQILLFQGDIVPLTTGGDCSMNLFPELPRTMSPLVRDFFENLQEGVNEMGAFIFQNAVMENFVRPVIPGAALYATNDGVNCLDPVGYSHRMFTDTCKDCLWVHGNDSVNLDVFQVAIPVSQLGAAIQTMSNIFNAYPVEFYFGGMLFRFLSASNGLLNINADQASVAIEWTFPARVDRYTKPRLGLPASQALLRALVAQHGGRTHWAKNGMYFSSPEMIQFQYRKRRDRFVEFMKEMDPQGIFLNDFGRRLRFGDHKMTLDNREKHCALSDHCTCFIDQDCGTGTPGEYKCGSVAGYNVCREEENFILRGGRMIGRGVINTLEMVQSTVLNVQRLFSSIVSG